MSERAPMNTMLNPAQTPGGAPQTRPATKQDRLVAMMQRPEGATLVQICDEAGWQPQTARGWITNAVRGRLGKTVDTEHIGNGRKIYRIR